MAVLTGTGSLILVKRLIPGYPVLVHDAVAQVAERQVQDDRRADVFSLSHLASCSSVKALNGELLELIAVFVSLKVGFSPSFDL